MSPSSQAILHTVSTEALIRAMSIMVEVDGMKAANAQFPDSQPHSAGAFDAKAARLRSFADYVSGCLSSHAALTQRERDADSENT